MTKEQQQLDAHMDAISATQSFLLTEMGKLRRMPAGEKRDQVRRELGNRAGQVWRELMNLMARYGVVLGLLVLCCVGCAGKNGESHPSVEDLRVLFGHASSTASPKSAGGPAHSIPPMPMEPVSVVQTQSLKMAAKDLPQANSSVPFIYPTNAARFPWWDLMASTNLVSWTPLLRNLHWPPRQGEDFITTNGVAAMRFYRMRGHVNYEP